MPLTRRSFLAASAGAVAVRAVPVVQRAPKARVVLKLVYDKSLGAMRAVERIVR
ncbi:Tat pathway signal protein [Nereida sp. MMG025]|uniref:Tat pathway signal protein n=1 Tax=Nereida sp. MMG025 TaxID=2909981 RepID=UPI001F1CF04E|nr:Tat pathway signal protein [Nereida sp. MMG025]MCF6445078.1 Tat pathway signal protein [Nereida sp. MMG025]